MSTAVFYVSATLSLGAQSDEVEALQRSIHLQFHPYVALRVDGYFGPKTLAAVKYVQCVGGLPVDGVVGDRTRAFINRGAYSLQRLSLGNAGTAVEAVQQTLAAAIPLDLVQDGVYGHLTATAVQLFQEQHCLIADGIVGPETWNRIVTLRMEGAVYRLFSDTSER
ncbi:MAG: peptidoglycan-binding protein [Cyanobacteria bacterium J06607_13]